MNTQGVVDPNGILWFAINLHLFHLIGVELWSYTSEPCQYLLMNLRKCNTYAWRMEFLILVLFGYFRASKENLNVVGAKLWKVPYLTLLSLKNP